MHSCSEVPYSPPKGVNASFIARRFFISWDAHRFNEYLIKSRNFSFDMARQQRSYLELIHESEHPTVDIVYVYCLDLSDDVHGLGSLHWLKEDLLPDLCPRARIFRFGYTFDSLYPQWTTTNAVDNTARDLLVDLKAQGKEPTSVRPLVFIAHGLGGLVVKALLSTELQTIPPAVAQKTQGVIFLGTPHPGHAKHWGANINAKPDTADYSITSWKQREVPAIADELDDIGRSFERISSLYEVAYICGENPPTCSSAQVAHLDCFWAFVSQEQRLRGNEHHYVLPDSYALPLLHSRIEYLIARFERAAKSEQERHDNILAQERAILRMYSNQRLPGTCDWLFARPGYRSWFDASGPACLWIHGLPGAGKTVLCSAILDDLEKRKPENGVIVYCFLDYRVEGADYAQNFLRSISHQLQDHELHPVSESILRTVLLDDHNAGSSMSPEFFKSHLRMIFAGTDPYTQIVLVVDGLCGDEWINGIIVDEVTNANLYRNESSRVKCSISSRTTFNTAEHFDEVTSVRMADEPGVHDDILQFARHKVGTLSRTSWENDSLQEALIEQLCSCADGMFLWIALVLESARHLESLSEILQNVQSAPSHIESMYQRDIERISPLDNNTAQRIFLWLTVASRPLTLSELNAALFMEAQHSPRLMQENVVKTKHSLQHFEAEVLRICGSLVIVTEGIIRFAHPSVRKYLVSQHGHQPPRCNIPEGHALLAYTCLSHLASEGEENSSLFYLASLQTIDDEYSSSFSNYVAANWSVHYRKAEIRYKWLNGILQRILDTGLKRVYRDRFKPKNSYSTDILHTALRFCSRYGLGSLTRMYLEMGSDPDGGPCTYCETPLHLAAAHGHVETAATLLDRGASVHARKSFNGETPLHLAAACGCPDMTKLLLKHGAQPDAATYDSARTPLHFAATEGHLEVVKLLMNCNIDVNGAMTGSKETPLHLAAAHGHAQIIKCLLDGRNSAFFEVEFYDSIVQQPYYQSWSVELLMGVGKNGRCVWDVDARCSAETDIERLKMYSRRHANIDMQTRGGRTAIHQGASNGHETVVRLLLERGADLQATDNSQNTPLSTAAKNGHLGVVSLLLARSTGATLGANNWGTVLEQAANNGHQTIADLLLWQAFGLGIMGKDLQWPMLFLAKKSGHNVVQNILRVKRAQSGPVKSTRAADAACAKERTVPGKLALHLRNM